MDSLQMFRVYVETVQCIRRSLAYSRQSADVTARKLSLRNLGFHNVTCLETAEHCLACAMCFGKATLIGSAHLTRTMPRRLDFKRSNSAHLVALRAAASFNGAFA